jgi:hypothetical protein
MKKIFIVSLMLPTFAMAQKNKQKGFVHVGPAIYQFNKGGQPLIGGSAGFGIYKGMASLGLTVEPLSQKDAGLYLPIYADLNLHFKKDHTGPFILVQPGLLARNFSIASNPVKITEKGEFYFGVGAGLKSAVKKAGLMVQVKYAVLSTKIYASKINPSQPTAYSRAGYFAMAINVIF